MKTKLPVEPKCPECGVGVDRPKCMFEAGSDCPRHLLMQQYNRECNLIEENNKLQIRLKKIKPICVEEKIDNLILTTCQSKNYHTNAVAIGEVKAYKNVLSLIEKLKSI